VSTTNWASELLKEQKEYGIRFLIWFCEVSGLALDNYVCPNLLRMHSSIGYDAIAVEWLNKHVICMQALAVCQFKEVRESVNSYA
jgi:hypothetical protein